MSFTYDDNGNLTDDGPNSYEYDVESQLIAVTTPDYEVSFAYDPLGRRIQKTVDDGENTETTRYVYDGLHVIAKYDGADTLLRKYIYGAGVDNPVAMIDVDGQSETWYYYHLDQLGSVAVLSDSSGLILEEYDYDACGATACRHVGDVNGDGAVDDDDVQALVTYSGPYDRDYDVDRNGSINSQDVLQCLAFARNLPARPANQFNYYGNPYGYQRIYGTVPANEWTSKQGDQMSGYGLNGCYERDGHASLQEGIKLFLSAWATVEAVPRLVASSYEGSGPAGSFLPYRI